MAEENSEVDLINPVEETPVVETPEEPKADESKPEADLEAKNKELFARAKKAEEELKKFKTQPKNQETGSDGEWKNKVEFLIKNRDFNEEEFDHVATVASRKGMSLQEAAEAEKEYITFRREKVNSGKKIPSPSSAGFPSFEKKITPDMKESEVSKILEERARKAQESNSGY